MGQIGPAGPTGPTGATGATGAAGKNATVTCKVSSAKNNKVKVTCSVKSTSKASIVRMWLTRSRLTVAHTKTGSHTSQLRFTGKHADYVLHAQIRIDGKLYKRTVKIKT